MHLIQTPLSSISQPLWSILTQRLVLIWIYFLEQNPAFLAPSILIGDEYLNFGTRFWSDQSVGKRVSVWSGISRPPWNSSLLFSLVKILTNSIYGEFGRSLQNRGCVGHFSSPPHFHFLLKGKTYIISGEFNRSCQRLQLQSPHQESLLILKQYMSTSSTED